MSKANIGKVSVMILSSWLVFGCMSLDPSGVIIKSFKEAPFDAILVPGCPYMKESYEELLLSRVYWSKYVWDRGKTKRIVYSGSSVYTPFIESKIMKEIAICIDIDSSAIRLEQKAQHSSENLYYFMQMAQDSGWKNVALATDVFQMKVLKTYIDAMEYDVKLIPIDFDRLGLIERFDIDIDASKAFVPNFITITDTLTKEQIKANSNGIRVFGDLNLK